MIILQSDNKSGVTGVSLDETNGRWLAYIQRGSIGKQQYFPTKELAIQWRLQQENYYRYFHPGEYIQNE